MDLRVEAKYFELKDLEQKIDDLVVKFNVAGTIREVDRELFGQIPLDVIDKVTKDECEGYDNSDRIWISDAKKLEDIVSGLSNGRGESKTVRQLLFLRNSVYSESDSIQILGSDVNGQSFYVNIKKSDLCLDPDSKITAILKGRTQLLDSISLNFDGNMQYFFGNSYYSVEFLQSLKFCKVVTTPPQYGSLSHWETKYAKQHYGILSSDKYLEYSPPPPQ